MVDFFQEAVTAYHASKHATHPAEARMYLEQAKVAASLADLEQRGEWAEGAAVFAANLRASGLLPPGFPTFPGESVPGG